MRSIINSVGTLAGNLLLGLVILILGIITTVIGAGLMIWHPTNEAGKLVAGTGGTLITAASSSIWTAMRSEKPPAPPA